MEPSSATAALNQIINTTTNHSSSAEIKSNIQTSSSSSKNQIGHRKGRYSLSVFSTLSQPTTNQPTTDTTPNLLTANLISPTYASLAPGPPNEPPTRLNNNRHHSLTPALPPTFLSRYLTPTSPSANNNLPSPVPGPSSSAAPPAPTNTTSSSRPEWPHTSASSSSASSSLRTHQQQQLSNLARSYSHLPDQPSNPSRFNPNPNRPPRNPIDNRLAPPAPNPTNNKDRASNNSNNNNTTTNPNSNNNNPGVGPSAASQLEAKVVILGMQGVGKTSIVHRYTTGSFSYSLTSTIGASFCTKKLSVDGCKVRLQIWDTAGQERFRSMAPMYYRGANAAILVYDITNKESFLDIQNWLSELRDNMGGDLIIQVVGSKADLAHERRAVEIEEAQARVSGWTAGSARADDGHLLLSPFVSSIAAAASTPSNTLASPNTAVIDEPSSSLSSSSATNNPSGNASGFGTSHVGITEVSAKDDFGIEELFLILSRRLVLRKTQIEVLRSQSSRDSVRIHDLDHPHHHHHHQQTQGAEDLSGWTGGRTRSSQAGFCC